VTPLSDDTVRGFGEMRGQITERIPSIVVGDLFVRGLPREEPAVIRGDLAGAEVEVVLTPLIDRVECTYRRWIGRSGPQEGYDHIPVSRTFPHYGGHRVWLQCGGPSCGRRVGRLFFLVDGSYFLCGSCARIRYVSQTRAKPKYEQKLERARAIRVRLGGRPDVGASFPPRPKGMHRRTYERLRREVHELERAENDRIAAALDSGEMSLIEYALKRVRAAPRKPGSNPNATAG
jgi:hypothetical protein